MPELPDVIVYIEALTERLIGRRIEAIRLLSPFVLRSVDPPIEAVNGAVVKGLRRIGKRIVLVFDRRPFDPPDTSRRPADLFLVIHLMIAGRLRWRAPGQKLGLGPKIVLAAFEFEHGTLFFTEASSKKRASIQMVRGEPALAALNPGGVEPLEASFEEFRRGLTRENHTLKRALTDPQLFSGIGNAYSDEILHAARLSPMKLSQSLSDDEMRRLMEATRPRSCSGSSVCARRRGPAFRRRSRLFATAWRSTAASVSLVPSADRRCSGSCRASTSATTVRLDELAAAMGKACRVPAGRAVAEVELDLADVKPGLQRVDRHPHLAAEAARQWEAGRARSLAQIALARQRLREQASSPRLREDPGGALRDPEAAALRPCERRDGKVAARLDQRPQVAVEVRVAEQQWPWGCDPLRGGERLALAEAWARHDHRARCARALGRPVARAVVGHDDLAVREGSSETPDQRTDRALLVAGSDEEGKPGWLIPRSTRGRMRHLAPRRRRVLWNQHLGARAPIGWSRVGLHGRRAR